MPNAVTFPKIKTAIKTNVTGMAGKLFWANNNILYPKNLFKILNISLKKISQLIEDSQSYGSVRCNWFIRFGH